MPTEPYTLKELRRLYTPSEMILLLRLGGFQNTQIFSCADGIFSDSRMGIEDIEMLAVSQNGAC